MPTGPGGGGRSAVQGRAFPAGRLLPAVPGRDSPARGGGGGSRDALAPVGQTGRSAFQCLQKFQQHNEALKRKEWTEQEDRVLTQLVQEMRVGSHIPYRKSKAAPGGRRPAPVQGALTEGGGSREAGRSRDVPGSVLSCQAAPFGVHEASLPPVVYYMEGRDSMQLIYRWTKSLDPSLKKGFWAPEEDAVGAGGRGEPSAEWSRSP